MAMNLTKLTTLLDQQEDPETGLDRIAKTYGLSDMQKGFVYYMVAFDGRRKFAALEAGYQSENKEIILDNHNQSEAARKARATLAVNTTNLMKNKKIINAIKEFKPLFVADRTALIKKDTYKFLQYRINFNPQDAAILYTATSRQDFVDKLLQLPPEVASCIEGFTYKIQGKFADEFIVDIKFTDKYKAIEQLARLDGLFDKNNKEQEKTSTVPPITINVLQQTNK